MAVVVNSVMGRVDTPVAALDLPTRPSDASQAVVEFTIQAADYSSGVALTNILTAVGGSAVLGATVLNVRVAAGTSQIGVGTYSTATGLLRYVTVITNQTTATDYTAVNNDVWRVLVTYL